MPTAGPWPTVLNNHYDRRTLSAQTQRCRTKQQTVLFEGFFLLFSHAVVLRDETTRTVMRYVCVIIAEDDQGEP